MKSKNVCIVLGVESNCEGGVKGGGWSEGRDACASDPDIKSHVAYCCFIVLHCNRLYPDSSNYIFYGVFTGLELAEMTQFQLPPQINFLFSIL